MGFLDKLFGNDRERAATKYAGRESASDSAAQARRKSYWAKGVPKAAAKGQAWEDRDRTQDQRGGWYKAAR
jgi:hypothetical protein